MTSFSSGYQSCVVWWLSCAYLSSDHNCLSEEWETWNAIRWHVLTNNIWSGLERSGSSALSSFTIKIIFKVRWCRCIESVCMSRRKTVHIQPLCPHLFTTLRIVSHSKWFVHLVLYLNLSGLVNTASRTMLRSHWAVGKINKHQSVRQIVTPSLPWAWDAVSYFHLLTSSVIHRSTSSLSQQRSSESCFMRDEVSLALWGRYVGTLEYHDMIHVHAKITHFHVFDTGYSTSRLNSAANVLFPILRIESLGDVDGGMRRIKTSGTEFKWTVPLLWIFQLEQKGLVPRRCQETSITRHRVTVSSGNHNLKHTIT